jgi:hypothetical protein
MTTVSSRAVSLSWIPTEAIAGPMRLGFAAGLGHYDPPPPDHLDDVPADVDRLRAADGFRFANVLGARAEFDGDRLVRAEQDGGVVMGATTVRVGPLDGTFTAVAMPELRPAAEAGPGWVRFTQTTGGRTALPLPRRISRPPYVRLQSPLVWTTLQLTLRADGSATVGLTGASPFPRHWVYDGDGTLALKAGVSDWRRWVGQPSWTATPWGDEHSAVVVAAAESALERELSTLVMHGAHRPAIRTLEVGRLLATQGEPGTSVFLVLDGVVAVTVDHRRLAELGPGAVLGERAVLESTARTATLTAVTRLKVAEVPADALDRTALIRLADLHRRELAREPLPG